MDSLVVLVTLASVWTRAYGVDLHLLGLFPITGEWAGGRSLLTAVQMAIEDINNREDILPGYTLNLTWANSNCDAGQGIKRMTDNIYQGPTKIAIVGCACSTASQATSQASHLWNLVQISYGSSSPALSIKTRFPKFMRLSPPDVSVIPVRIRMFQQFGWTRVATIYQAYELFTMINDDLVEALQEANITLVTSEVFKISPVQHVQRLKDKDARVIVGGFYPEEARPVFCESFKHGLIYPRVIWILIGWLTIDWWAEPDPGITCTREEMARAVEGVFYTGSLYLDPFNSKSLSGLRPTDFTALHFIRNGNRSMVGDLLASQGYDVIWTVALGLNATMEMLENSGSGKRLEDFTYDDADFGDMIHHNMMNLSFQALMGHVTFDKNGDPSASTIVEQYQDGKRVVLCYARPDDTQPLNLSLARWKDGHPPRDGVETTTRVLSLSRELSGFMCTLSALGILLSAAFLVFNVYNRNIKFIKLSSPRLNNVILVGCMVTFTSVFLASLDPLISCQTRNYPSFIGWSLIFGALFSKTWRVHLIFTNVKLQKKVIKDTHLFLMVGGLTVFNLLTLIIWSVFDPQSISWDQMSTESKEDGDVVINYIAAICHSTYRLYFEVVLFGVQAVLLMLGAFLSWETRKVKVEALNDSKNIAVCIYNSAVLIILYIIISVTVTLKPDLHYGFMATIFIINATSIQCIIFVPKVLQYRQYRISPETERGLTMGNDMTTPPSNEGSTMETKLKEKDKEIALLHDKIHQLSLLIKEQGGGKVSDAQETNTGKQEADVQ